MRRFRSVNEFLPHARWLYDVNSESPCLCKYCGNSGTKYQREITAALGAPHITRQAGPTGKPSFGVPRTYRAKPQVRHPPVPPPVPARKKTRSAKSSAHQTPTAPAKPLPLVYPTLAETVAALESTREYFHLELHADLAQGRTYRRGDVLWASVHPPLIGANPGDIISYWPGLVTEIHLEITYEKAKPDTDEIHLDITSMASSSTPSPEKKPQRIENHVYEVKLLATSQVDTYYDTQLLPLPALRVSAAFLAKYASASQLGLDLHELVDPTNPSKDTFLKQCRGFRPILKTNFDLQPASPPPNFKAAIPSFIIAITMTERVASQYETDHEWGKNIQDKRTSGAIGESHFQGLWWGAERIWMGDLVRLLPQRESFPPHIRAMMLPPAPKEFTQSRSGLFLHLANIMGDPPSPKGSLFKGKEKEEVQMMSGFLYELVRSDWLDPHVLPIPPASKLAPGRGPGVNSAIPSSSANSDLSSSTSSNETVRNHGLSTKPRKDGISSSVSDDSPTENQAQPPNIHDIFPLPKPPPRSKWRAVLSGGNLLDIPILVIAGRYYPTILDNPIVDLDLNDLDRAIGPDPSPKDSLSLLEDPFRALNPLDPLFDGDDTMDFDMDFTPALRSSSAPETSLPNVLPLMPYQPAALTLQFTNVLSLNGFPYIPRALTPLYGPSTEESQEDEGYSATKVWSEGRAETLGKAEEMAASSTWKWITQGPDEDSVMGEGDRDSTPTPTPLMR